MFNWLFGKMGSTSKPNYRIIEIGRSSFSLDRLTYFGEGDEGWESLGRFTTFEEAEEHLNIIRNPFVKYYE